ncbi:hypothetical protein [Chitinophaga silvisoli]|uniref:DUF2691 family protein n=1 Tax=Chitinophaga silvisoli TaxID=2291814 RepID=A0A3E1NT42_9BACT|nr:hypothetical protein [Chitinophaga silvisoli]RFM30938.1 hypothetical protein DXN04_31910 [Chitinophaga silvisoli]
MNWIISKTRKMNYHTNLRALMLPVWEDIKNYQWVVSDLEYMSSDPVPINYEQDYFILSPEEFSILANADLQIIWGVICGIPADEEIEIDEDRLPYVEGNDLIWENGNIQLEQAVIEIVCFDSSYTILKFKNVGLSEKFKSIFEEAIELEKFK